MFILAALSSAVYNITVQVGFPQYFLTKRQLYPRRDRCGRSGVCFRDEMRIG